MPDNKTQNAGPSDSSDVNSMGGDVYIHTLQDDLDMLEGKIPEEKNTATIAAPPVATVKKADADKADDSQETGKAVPKSTSPFLSSVPASAYSGLPKKAPAQDSEEENKKRKEELLRREAEKRGEEKINIQQVKKEEKKGGFFGLFRRSEKKEEEVKKIEAKKPEAIFIKKEEPVKKEVKKDYWSAANVIKDTEENTSGIPPITAPRMKMQEEAEKKPPVIPQPTPAKITSPIVEKAPIIEKPISTINLRETTRPATAPRIFPIETKPPVIPQPTPAKIIPLAAEKAIAIEKPATKKETEEKSGGLFGMFTTKNNEKSEERKHVLEQKNKLEQENKKIEQEKIRLDEEVRRHLAELKESRENEEKIKKHIQELRETEAGLDRHVVEKNLLLKERLKRAEELKKTTDEREAKINDLKVKIVEMEKSMAEKAEKIKEAEKKTGFFGIIRKIRNRRLLEKTEHLRHIHFTLEQKNKELEKIKEILEIKTRQHGKELKDFRENEEKIKKRLAELREAEIKADQQTNEKSQDLKEKFEQLKASLERQINEKSQLLKEKTEKLEEANKKTKEREIKMNEVKQKIEELEKGFASRETSAKARVEELEKKAVFQESNAKARLAEMEKRTAAQEASVKARMLELERMAAAKEANIKNVPKKGGLFGLFGGEKAAEKTQEALVKTAEAVKRESLPEIKRAAVNQFDSGPSHTAPIPTGTGEIAVKQEPKKEAPEGPIISKKPHWGRVIAGVLTAIILIVFGAGGYLFWVNRKASLSIQNTQVTEPPVVEVELEEAVFSADKPNYLSVDVESASPASIGATLNGIAQKMEKSIIDVPVEFVVTDSNNNPLAFSIFARLAGLKFSPEFLNTLEEGFSLYVFSDKGNIRLSLAIDLKNRAEAVSSLLRDESNLTGNLSPLFLGVAVSNEAKFFNDGNYKGFLVRYENLDSLGTISIDYTFTGSQFVLGTSKDTLRAVLDKIGVAAIKDGTWQ